MALFQLNRGLFFRFLWQSNLIDLLWFCETFCKPARPFEKVSIAVGRRQNLLIWHIVGLPVDYIDPATAHLFKMADALTPKTSLAIRQAPICSQTCSQSTPTTRLVGVLLWSPWRWSCLKTLGWHWLLPRGRLWPRGAPGRPLALLRAGLPGRWRVLAWAACTLCDAGDGLREGWRTANNTCFRSPWCCTWLTEASRPSKRELRAWNIVVIESLLSGSLTTTGHFSKAAMVSGLAIAKWDLIVGLAPWIQIPTISASGTFIACAFNCTSLAKSTNYCNGPCFIE